MPEYWNHNVHYQRVILDAVPPGCGQALDVGSGDGMLAARLTDRCAAVTGIDQDAAMVAAARERAKAAAFIEADFLAYPFGDASFDFVCANTSLHHMDFGEALRKLARILRPGGRLAVVGLARDGSAADRLIGAAGIPADRLYKARYGEGNSGAPICEPDMTWAQVGRTARAILPGARYRRLLLWRYAIVWRKPAG